MSEEEEEDNEYLGSVNPSVSPSVKTRLASVPTATPAQYNSPTNNTKHAQQKKQYTRHEAHASPLEDAPIRHETCDPCACLTVSCRVFFKRKTHAQDAARQHFLLAFLGCLFLCLMFVLMFLVAYLRSPAKTRRFDTPLSEQTRPPNSRLLRKEKTVRKRSLDRQDMPRLVLHDEFKPTASLAKKLFFLAKARSDTQAGRFFMSYPALPGQGIPLFDVDRVDNFLLCCRPETKTSIQSRSKWICSDSDGTSTSVHCVISQDGRLHIALHNDHDNHVPSDKNQKTLEVAFRCKFTWTEEDDNNGGMVDPKQE